MLLENGLDINAKNGGGETPLFIASKYSEKINSTKIIKLLLDNGADINIQDNFGLTPLHIASQFSDITTVRFLLDNYCISIPLFVKNDEYGTVGKSRQRTRKTL